MLSRRNFSINSVLIVAGLVGLSILAVTLSSSSTTGATTPPEGNEITSSDDVIQHLSKVRGISLEEAKKRATWQDHASTLNDQLAKTLPKEDFGGVWIHKDNDRVQVGLSNGSRVGGTSRQIIDQKVRENGLDSAVDFVPVDASFSDLVAIKDWISKISQDRLTKTDWPIQVEITTDTNQVQIYVPKVETNKLTSNHQGILNDIRQRYGEKVRTETYSELPHNESCNFWFCDDPLRGGVGIKGSNNGYEDGTNCTAGFNVIGNSGTKYVVTAGHCSQGGTGWATEEYNYVTKKIGPIHGNLNGQNGVDAMIIEIREAYYGWDAVRGWVYVRPISSSSSWPYSGPSYNEEYDITGYDTSGDLINSRVCVSGAISSYYDGGTCGPIHAVEGTWTLDGVKTIGNVRAGYCSRAGDSGAPIFRLGKAMGIHRGYIPPEQGGSSATCSEYKLYTGMQPILNGFNYTISIL